MMSKEEFADAELKSGRQTSGEVWFRCEERGRDTTLMKMLVEEMAVGRGGSGGPRNLFSTQLL